jgi:RHS repeat-associated protein
VYSYDGSLLTSVSKGNIQRQYLNYTYDNNFHLTDQEVWVPDTSGNDYDKLSEYAYDNDGNITGISLYDVTSNGLNPGPAMSISYDPNNGRVMGTTLGNVNTSQSYDSNGALSYFETDFGGSSIFQTSYQRDSLNRIRILTEVNQGQMTVKKYAYDIVGRLSQVWRNDTLISTYSYDPNGNRIARCTPSKIDSGFYDAQDRVLSYGNAQYIYSRNGELQKKISGTDTTSYAYDYFGNLLSVRLPGHGGQANGDFIEYIIDGQNRRIGKKINGAIVKKWIYAGGLSPIAELDSAYNVTAEFVGSLMIKNGNTYQLITDHLGSVRLVVDINSGNIIQQLDYDEFGNVLSDSNPDFQPFAYAGGLYDSQTKLVRFGARDYDASVGRWTCKDPIGFKGESFNIYGYCSNDPINYYDDSGLKLWYANANALEQFGNNIKEMMKSCKGRKLLKRLNDSPMIYKIHATNEGYSHTNRALTDVYIDPNFHPIINTTAGDQLASTTRQLAHELGHLTGVKDTPDPGDRMDNVNTWENPIMEPIEGYDRTTYDTIIPMPGVTSTPDE